jgi:GcrA cell cycle regulator
MSLVPYAGSPFIKATNFAWTKENVDRLKIYWSDGDTADLIADKLGCSRNAVIGKVHRLGLNKSTGVAGAPRVRHRRVVGEKVDPVEADGANVPIERRRTLLDIGPRECHWPFGDPVLEGFFYCGAAVSERSYCAYHCRIAGGAPRPYVRRDTATFRPHSR